MAQDWRWNPKSWIKLPKGGSLYFWELEISQLEIPVCNWKAVSRSSFPRGIRTLSCCAVRGWLVLWWLMLAVLLLVVGWKLLYFLKGFAKKTLSSILPVSLLNPLWQKKKSHSCTVTDKSQILYTKTIGVKLRKQGHNGDVVIKLVEIQWPWDTMFCLFTY